MEEKRLFGEIAIEKGYLRLDQLRRALAIQREIRRSGEGQKLIGVLLVELGYMTADQVVDTLEAYDSERASSVDGARALREREEAPDPLLPLSE